MRSSVGGYEFRDELESALAETDAGRRCDRLSQLSQRYTGFRETIQLSHAVSDDASLASAFPSVRLAILSNCTVDHLLPAIRVGGLRHRLDIRVYASGFNQYAQELFDPSSRLHEFRPDAVLFSLTARPVVQSASVTATQLETEQALRQFVDEVRDLWKRARSNFGAAVLQQSFLDVFEPIFGNLDRRSSSSCAWRVDRLNELAIAAANEEGVLLLDIARASARDGIDAWFDNGRWLQAKMEIDPLAAVPYGEQVARLVAAQRGRSRKCLVLDLDDTLWGGVVGELGPDAVVLGEGSAQGEAHLELQRYAMRLKERGVILAVCSKNDLEVAESMFRDNPNMVLGRSDFAAFVANWSDKSENLRSIADQLNIGLDSLVFVDDNPAERARVRESLPEVAVPELPDDPARYARTIADAGYFEAVSFTIEDRDRAQHYVTNTARESLRRGSLDLDEFLRRLDMSVVYGPVSTVDIARASQLIGKTNQFNTTARPCGPEALAQLSTAPENLALQFRLTDRFGDNGLVSVMLLRPAEEEAGALEIANWVMSCRVFGRQLEMEAMNIAVEFARGRSIRHIYADYVATGRNRVVSDLFEKLGFARYSREGLPHNTTRWKLRIDDYVARPTFIARKAA